jgi:micrococcal nuclease|tara:strand:+ start:380 stop:721 length:342 start_codon:yes stop_codon:yes gene_type:complete
MFEYTAICIKIVDGDTVDAMIDLGFGTWVKRRIRLYGINAPESRTRDLEEKQRGLAAKARLIDLLQDKEFTLKSHGVGKYGRCLGSIFLANTDVNKLLISEGHAVEYLGGKRV